MIDDTIVEFQSLGVAMGEYTQGLGKVIHRDLSSAELIEQALARGEAVRADNGAICVTTGKRTGRSPLDRYIVKEPLVENTIDWGPRNQAIDEKTFLALWDKSVNHIKDKETFVSHLHVGANKEHQVAVTLITEYAWHNLFARLLFIRDGEHKADASEWTMLNVPKNVPVPGVDGVQGDAALIFHFGMKRILLCGLHYAGEMKKAMFGVLNYLLPEKDVLPMHCSANTSHDGEVALFFGLSGTGKTTLSADPERLLIGDDEHGWSKDGVFNFEGGCYAKCIDLSEKNEPVIWSAIRDGALIENVVLDPASNKPDYHDTSLTQNSRAAYPLEHISGRVPSSQGAHPKVVIFLTCDLYGVLPPVAKLDENQAAYYFLSGYTALVGSTEVGQASAIKPVFSTCFGAPFFPRPANVYAQLLIKRLRETNAKVYLVNTGWHKGPFGEGGERFSIPTTRAVVHAILNGAIEKSAFETLPGFNFAIPTQLPGVDEQLLDPRKTWADQAAYEEKANLLIQSFISNFTKFEVDEAIKAAAPKA